MIDNSEKEYFIKHFKTYFDNDINAVYQFLNSVDPNKIKKLLGIISFYDYYQESIKKDDIYIKPVLLLSIIEGIIGNDYKDFYNWLDEWFKKTSNKTIKKEQIEKEYKKYKENFGCNKILMDFVEKYLTKNEKKELIKNYLYEVKYLNFQPICFEECNGSNNIIKTNHCKNSICILEDEKKLCTYSKKVMRDLYNRRSRGIVHNGRILSLVSQKGSTLTDIDKKGKWLNIKMDNKKFENMMLSGLVNFIKKNYC